MKNRAAAFNISVGMLLLAVIMGIVAKLYHSFVFLPAYYGSFGNSLKVIFSFEQAAAYLKDPVGLTLFIAPLALLGGGFLIMWWQVRKSNETP